ncbi:MAG: ribosome recycling factor [Alphaproteobacteria bacterium]|nr:ribosome recycling factor [Alphaproteobacteria bacterium]
MSFSDFKSLKKDVEHRMKMSVEVIRKEFGGLRTGRASTAILENITVEAYGSVTPLTQVGTVSVPEPSMLSVQVWDKTQVKAVEKAIREAGIGLNPMADGTLIRVPVPPLSEERRAELAKIAAKYAEEGRIAIRNVRRDGMEALKKMEKDNHISEDEQHRHIDDVQKITDTSIKEVDNALHNKQEEIMQV